MLILRGCFDGIHGYGAFIRSHLRLLDELAIDYRIIQLRLDPNTLRNDEIKKWRRRLTSKSNSHDTVIHFCEAPYIEVSQDCKNIAYTLWEVDRLPNLKGHSRDIDWVTTLNQCDEVWTGSSAAKEAFQISGVNIPITVVPWVIDNPSSNSESTKLKAIELNSWQPQPTLHRKFWSIYHWISKLPRPISWPLISMGYLTHLITRPILGFISAFFAQLKTKSLELKTTEFIVLNINTYNKRKNFEDWLAGALSTLGQNPNVVLLIKTHQAVDTWWMRSLIVMDLQRCIENLKIQSKAKVRLILNKLTDAEMNSVMASATIFLNTSHGEGIGGGVLQAMSHGVPAVTHLFSSFKDFCDRSCAFVYEHSLEPVSWHFNFYGMGQKWARIHHESMAAELERAYAMWRNHKSEFQNLKDRARDRALAYGNSERVAQIYLSLQANLNFQSRLALTGN